MNKQHEARSPHRKHGSAPHLSGTFKDAFKFFRSIGTPLLDTFKNLGVPIADPRDKSSVLWKPLAVKNKDGRDAQHPGDFGLRPVGDWCVRELVHAPGSIVVSDAFTDDGQRRWMRKCLVDLPKQTENISNLDFDWNQSHKESRKETGWFTPIEDAAALRKGAIGKVKLTRGSKHKRKKMDSSDLLERSTIWKLRWITLGYHHNWDTKVKQYSMIEELAERACFSFWQVYSEQKHTPFPEDIADLCSFLADTLGFADFTAQAAIINYYHLNSTLSAHQDISEPYQEAPLFSISFGQPAIFLIGPSKDKWPNAVLLHSGDIFVMSGQSRLDFHAVPRIFAEAGSYPCFSKGQNQKDVLDDYLERSRINMNIRQVLKPGQTAF